MTCVIAYLIYGEWIMNIVNFSIVMFIVGGIAGALISLAGGLIYSKWFSSKYSVIQGKALFAVAPIVILYILPATQLFLNDLGEKEARSAIVMQTNARPMRPELVEECKSRSEGAGFKSADETMECIRKNYDEAGMPFHDKVHAACRSQYEDSAKLKECIETCLSYYKDPVKLEECVDKYSELNDVRLRN